MISDLPSDIGEVESTGDDSWVDSSLCITRAQTGSAGPDVQMLELSSTPRPT